MLSAAKHLESRHPPSTPVQSLPVKRGYVYILANRSRTLYIGVTSNLASRVSEHQAKLVAGFTQRYRITTLVFWEEHPTMLDAIAREKQLKGWRRSKKVSLIESVNPGWRDLSDSVP